MPKRNDVLPLDDTFMALAKVIAKRSPDPNTQVGACIVSSDNKVVSLGYNNFPNNCDDEFPWNRDEEDPLQNKYLYVVHSELNAILDAQGKNLKGCKIYVTLFPCNECTKAIIQAGISEVIYLSDKDHHKNFSIASRRMLNAANIKIRQFEPKHSIIL